MKKTITTFANLKTESATIAKKFGANIEYSDKELSANAVATSENDILSLLMYRELKAALTDKSTTVVLDCDYSKSRTLDRALSVGYYRILSTDKTFDSKLQLKRDGADRLHFNVSVKYIPILEEVKGLTIKVKVDKQGHAKNVRINTTYQEVVSVYKTLRTALATDPTEPAPETDTKKPETSTKKPAKKSTKK